MPTVKDIFNALSIIAPIGDSLSYDNEGLLMGSFKEKVTKTLIALDATPAVCDEAVELGANLILTHHPVLFKPLRAFTLQGALIKLLKHDMNLVVSHTSLDVSVSGVNFQLSQKLGLKNVDSCSCLGGYTVGLMGDLPNEMDSVEFAQYVSKSLNCRGVRYTERKGKIRKVAVCGGAGSFVVRDAILANADAFVTGEIKHSEILVANDYNLAIVEAGHFKTEALVLPFVRDYLHEWFPEEQFIVTKVLDDNLRYFSE